MVYIHHEFKPGTKEEDIMKNKGFTLIELLITVLIVLILAGYSVMAYLDSVQDTEHKKAISRLQVINTGYERYLAEHPGVTLAENVAFKATAKTACNATLPPAQTHQRLVNCGYIPNFGFDNPNEKYEYFLCNTCGGPRAYAQPKFGQDVGDWNKKRIIINPQGGVDHAIIQ